MNILQSILGWLSTPPKHATGLTTKHIGHQERALLHLVAHGEITLADIRGNHRTKTVQRLREQGYIKPYRSAGGERYETNAKTGNPYKVYIWTGKIPASWVKSPSYTGKDRRKMARGCTVERRAN